MKDLQHPLNLSLGDQGDGNVGDKPLLCKIDGARELPRLIGETLNSEDAPFQCCAAGVSLSQTQVATLQGSAAETAVGRKLQGLGVGVEQEHAGGVHLQVRRHLIQDDVEHDAQIQAGGDGHVDAA